MKTREVTLASGESFTVPQGIQRLDSKTTRGWQVRYQGTKNFADGQEGPKKSLDLATRELLRRIARYPAPAGLKRTTSPRKTSALPVGISGPIVINKAGSERQSAVLSVLVPRFGQPNQVREIHIGTPATYSKARYREALAKAVQLRQESQEKYEAAATRARRKDATEMRRSLVSRS